MTQPDELLASSRWRPLRLLLEAMDRDVGSLYESAGISGLRPRFVGPLIQLAGHDSMTIQELAGAVEVTHSAMSQTAAAMRTAGFVDSATSTDGRTRRIRLSATGRAALPFLRAEWRATEATVRDLEREIAYPLTQVVADIHAALATRSFHDRLTTNLAAAQAGTLT